MRPLHELTLSQFVQAIGEDRPTPGCGGAGAASLALAAACARKAFGISARRRHGNAGLEAAAERCRILSEAAVAGVQRDADNFEASLKAVGPEPELALQGDGQVLMALSTELRGLINQYADAIAPDLGADAAAALALAKAFEDIEARNLLEF